MRMSSTAEVVVVGGGIGGATLMAALALAGIDALLVEQEATVEPLGAGIALMPPAIRVADWLGLGPALHARSASNPVLRRCRADGSTLHEVAYERLWGGAGFGR
jgi:2-polyprenyl-6-methoxyphenol hydroxylase-like FAD-dependent oxidoreductase